MSRFLIQSSVLDRDLTRAQADEIVAILDAAIGAVEARL